MVYLRDRIIRLDPREKYGFEPEKAGDDFILPHKPGIPIDKMELIAKMKEQRAKQGTPARFNVSSILMKELRRWYKPKIKVPGNAVYDWSVDVTALVRKVHPDAGKACLYGRYQIKAIQYAGKKRPPRRTPEDIVSGWEHGEEKALLYIDRKGYPELANHPEAEGWYWVIVPARLLTFNAKTTITPQKVVHATTKTTVTPTPAKKDTTGQVTGVNLIDFNMPETTTARKTTTKKTTTTKNHHLIIPKKKPEEPEVKSIENATKVQPDTTELIKFLKLAGWLILAVIIIGLFIGGGRK